MGTQVVLHLTFLQSESNRKTTIRIPDPKENITEEEVLMAMEAVVENDFLGSRAKEVDSAKIVETTTQLLDIEIVEE